MKPDIVVTTKSPAWLREALDNEFTCHRLYEAKDRNAFLTAVAPVARGLASFAGVRVDGALRQRHDRNPHGDG